MQVLCEWIGYEPSERLLYLDELLSNVDVSRIAPWRGITEKLVLYFPVEHHPIITEWVDNIGWQRDTLVRKPLLKESLLEVLLSKCHHMTALEELQQSRSLRILYSSVATRMSRSKTRHIPPQCGRCGRSLTVECEKSLTDVNVLSHFKTRRSSSF